ncbi:hypothetical protein [Curtobacterium sp. MCBD17_032]|uniref:hypothetical protein n=1 Tax=Curtobacterium sp. MCBD17_032 TaxID=2175659 RepID=UPI000DA7FF48|nr:hypothetical protein [Curtobacterium sp. MCBD17_032]PZE86401.1 hypothetical protein DEI91_04755 [Curtobacterium sp. MCBD17_032]
MTDGPGAVPGRVEVTTRALTSCARAVAAERLGAPTKRVRVDLGDANGALALAITGPVAAGTDLVEATTSTAAAIRSRVSALTGRRVGSARIELTGIVRERDRRVR